MVDRPLVKHLGRWLPPALALAFAVLAVAPALAVPGLVATRAGGDSPFLLQRVHQMATALASGHFPPRWMPDAAYGLGYPFWNFYAPLSYLTAGVLALLGGGVVGAIKVTTLLVFSIAALGAYRLAKGHWDSSAAGVIAAASYTFAPYHMVNVYVRGDALAEVAAYAAFPWVLVAVDAARRERTADSVAGLAVALAVLLVSHNVSALLFAPVLAAYVLWRLVPRPAMPSVGPVVHSGDDSVPGQSEAAGVSRTRLPQRQASSELIRSSRRWHAPAAVAMRALLHLEHLLWPLSRVRRGKGVISVMLGLFVGLLLAAWFWVPALLERGAVNLDANLTGYFHYGGHFRGLDVVDLAPVFQYSMEDGCGACRTGLAQLAVAALGALAALWIADRRAGAAFWLIVAGVATFMMTAASEPLWGALPLLHYAQFPWRWLSVQALALAMLAAPLGCLKLKWPVALLASGVLAMGALSELPVDTLPVAQVTREDIAAFELFSGNVGSTVRAEYLPAEVDPRPMSGAPLIVGSGTSPRPLTGLLDGTTRLRRGPVRQEWKVDVADDLAATVAFPTHGFPGWLAAIDGGVPRRVETVDGSGWIAVEVPPGRHDVVLALERSDVRAIAEGASLLGAIAVFLMLVVNRRRRWLPVVVLAAVTVAAAAGVARLLPVAPADGPLTMDFDRLPYPHYNPGGLAFGESKLVAAGVKRGAVQAGEGLFVNLTWHDPWAGWQVEAALVTPAEAMPALEAPDVRATVEQNQGDPGPLVLQVPEDVPSGLYFVRLRVFDEQEEVQPIGPNGEKLGTTYLGPVTIRGKGEFRDMPEPPVARMGDVKLHVVSPVQEGSSMEVRLFWETSRALTANYKTSVRLIDPEGEVVAQNDKQPLYGFYPTTAWVPGEQILDKRWLSLPDGISPASDYLVEVVLYEAHSGEEIGTGRVSGVKVERWDGWEETPGGTS